MVTLYKKEEKEVDRTVAEKKMLFVDILKEIMEDKRERARKRISRWTV